MLSGHSEASDGGLHLPVFVLPLAISRGEGSLSAAFIPRPTSTARPRGVTEGSGAVKRQKPFSETGSAGLGSRSPGPSFSAVAWERTAKPGELPPRARPPSEPMP